MRKSSATYFFPESWSYKGRKEINLDRKHVMAFSPNKNLVKHLLGFISKCVHEQRFRGEFGKWP